MLTRPKTVRWYILTLLIVFLLLLFSTRFDNASFRNQNDIKLESEIVPVNLSIDEPVIKQQDISYLTSKYDIAVTHAPLQWTEKDLTFFKSVAGETVFSQLAVIPEAHEKPDFSKMVASERLFKSLFMHFDRLIAQNTSMDPSVEHKETWDLYKRLETTLYPWIYPYWKNAFHIANQTSGQGIVMCVGNGQFKFAASSIRTIREVLHCDLPIEIFFIRENDLSQAKRYYLSSEFTNIRLMKLEDYVSTYYTRFGGWAMKPFAMLASTFTEIIMMDADVFFLQDPALLLDDPAYKKTGSLFFYDRTLFAGWEKGPDWLRSFLSTMSPLVPKTRWFKGTSSHEQESGVVVMNKKKSLLGLLSTCKLNGITERDEVVYKHIHGDKETFWIGHEIMQTPYSFIKSYGAVIGNMGRGGDDGDTSYVCGVQLHLDTSGLPLWLNGGLYRNKNKQPFEYLNFTHYAEGEDWQFETHCIKDTDKIYEIPNRLRSVALASIKIDIQREKDQQLIDQGTWKHKESKGHHF
ncbi:hypothetical protein INT48_006257 [Thamnidium elegans]|uniref:Alpha-1,3-mannosyltransferase n=1 Tax=Thamnidium elegans TaxID=101142 RepID=A0A8H7VSI4_9FUNG|nr:hypothetical protein INT48_006257 [Thamnidium elegans]